MATVATLETVMRLNSTAFRQGMVQAANQANASLNAITKKAGETASVLLSLKRAAETFGSFYLLKEGLGALLEAQVQLQAIHYTLIAATGSSSKAADAFGFVRAEADKLGLVLPDAAQGFANLSASATAAGVSMKDQQQLFDAYAKSATSLHLSTVQSNRALLALEQMFAKGKIQAQELRLQLGQAIPGAAQRFQNAVMEMTKGTDLAGKSFDQLLEAGALTTSKFLPALVSALEISGRGWEDASKGLNASLNRVQTAWFNLKTELTNGLFTDVATAGAGALADNLSRIAGLIAVIGAGGLAKIGGTALSSGADRVTRLRQGYEGARMAAAAEVAYAQKIAATAEAELAAAAAQKQVLAARQVSGAALIAENRQLAFNAQAQKDSALALQAKQLGLAEASRSAMVLQVAEERLAAAESKLAAAQARVNAEMALAGPLSDKYAAAQGRLVAAQTAAAAAAVRVTEVRAAEAALGGFAAAAGRAAKSFGTFALSLVGGPWGLAIAAIGGLGYAIYSANKRWDEYIAKADEVAKANDDVTATLKALADAYDNVNTRPDAGALKAGLDSAGKAASDARKKLDDLIAKRAELQDQRDRTTARGGPGFLIDPKIAELDAKIAHARSTMDDLTAASSKTQMQLVAELTPAILNSANPALDFLATKVYGARDAMEALHNLASLPSAFADFIPQAIEASKAFDAYTKSADASSAAALKSIQNHSKSNEGLAQVRYNLLTTSAAYKNMTADQKAAAKATFEADAALGRGLDALSNKTKTHKEKVDAAAQAYLNLKNAQEGEAATLRGQLAGTDGYSAAQKALNVMLAGGTAEFRKLTEARQAEIIANQKGLVALQADVDKRNLAIASARQLADLDRQLADEQADRDRQAARQVEGVGHGAQWNAERAALEALTDETRKKMAAEDAAYRAAVDQATIRGNLGAVQAQLDETHLQMIGKIQIAGSLAAESAQADFEKMRAAQADWSAGLHAGIENFVTEQQNNAKQAEQMVGDFTTGFAGAFTDFASGAKSASDAFGGMIDDMYKKALAFVANKAIMAIFQSFMPGGGGWGGLAGNLAGAFGFSAGPGTIGAGLATGGPAAAGSVHPVVEKGPEMLSIGARRYLLMGDKPGRVTPLGEGGSGRSVTNITNINVQPTSTRRTADQIAQANARAQRLATTRNG